MISFEEMPTSAQKSYKITNIVRKGTVFISWVLFVLMMFNVVPKEESFIICIPFSLVFGGFIHGIVHGEFIYKKVLRKMSFGGLIGIGIGFLVDLVIGEMFGVIGSIYLIIDTIRFIKRKPLVYSFEHKYFLETQKAQEEMTANAYNELLNVTHSNDAVIKIQQLKEMMEQGTITEEEYNQKKAELLERI